MPIYIITQEVLFLFCKNVFKRLYLVALWYKSHIKYLQELECLFVYAHGQKLLNNWQLKGTEDCLSLWKQILTTIPRQNHLSFYSSCFLHLTSFLRYRVSPGDKKYNQYVVVPFSNLNTKLRVNILTESSTSTPSNCCFRGGLGCIRACAGISPGFNLGRRWFQTPGSKHRPCCH